MTSTDVSALAHPLQRVAKKKKTFPDAVKNGDLRVGMTLAGLANHYFKSWCVPNQKKILELTQRFHGRAMSVRTLNRHLAALERDGDIIRKQRHRRDKRLGMVFSSTLYHVTAQFMRKINNVLRALKRVVKSAGVVRSSVRVPFPAEYVNLSFKGYKHRR